jgi:hypothetical protein
MKPATIIILKYSGLLLFAFLIAWWFCFFSPFNIPEYIPHTPIKIYGLILTALILTTLILSQKELLKENEIRSVINLTLLGTVINFVNELIFQFILSFTETSDKLYHFIMGTTTTTIFCAILSFFVAFQLKTKRTGRLIFYICVSLIAFKVLTILVPSIAEHD